MESRTRVVTPGPHRIAIAAALVVVAAILAVGVRPSSADHGLPHPELLARGTFIEQVAAQLRVKVDGRATEVTNVADASDVAVVKITLHDGATAPWHGHSGPAILVNQGPGILTSVLSGDCSERSYPPGTALVEPGGGTIHTARNTSGEDLVLYVIFLGVQAAPVLPADPPPGCTPF